jgi:hypothetical protein
MPSKDYFRNLAQMSRRVAKNMTDKAVSDRLEAMASDYEQMATRASDADPAKDVTPPPPTHHGEDEHT